jgi:hypothetical protein
MSHSDGNPANNTPKKEACAWDKTLPLLLLYRKKTLETLINEEAGLLAQYLRGERKEWMPRLPRNALLYNSSGVV